jgi:hypothetical protein
LGDGNSVGAHRVRIGKAGNHALLLDQQNGVTAVAA